MRTPAVGTLGIVVALWAAACSSEDGCANGSCLGVDGGSDAFFDGSVDAGSDAVTPPNCDLSKDPNDSPACVDDGLGVFVDATGGNDANPGTKAQPLASISAALTKVGAKPRIYVCLGTYAEDVSPGCTGGNGGPGGAGGAGGGGAGGVSVGVLLRASTVALDTATTDQASIAPQGGSKGVGGAPGVNDGVDGVAQATLEIQ